MEVLARMAILRVVATADVTAGPAQAQVHPGVAGLEALLAAVGVAAIRLDGIEMRAAYGHACSPVLPPVASSCSWSVRGVRMNGWKMRLPQQPLDDLTTRPGESDDPDRASVVRQVLAIEPSGFEAIARALVTVGLRFAGPTDEEQQTG